MPGRTSSSRPRKRPPLRKTTESGAPAVGSGAGGGPGRIDDDDRRGRGRPYGCHGRGVGLSEGRGGAQQDPGERDDRTHLGPACLSRVARAAENVGARPERIDMRSGHGKPSFLRAAWLQRPWPSGFLRGNRCGTGWRCHAAVTLIATKERGYSSATVSGEARSVATAGDGPRVSLRRALGSDTATGTIGHFGVLARGRAHPRPQLR